MYAEGYYLLRNYLVFEVTRKLSADSMCNGYDWNGDGR